MRTRPLALAACLAALAGCTDRSPIRVGLVTGLTGRHSDLGLSSRDGATLAVEEINRAGGVGGRPLELLVRDDGQDPAQARRAVEALADAGVVALVGHATSSMAVATLDLVESRRLLEVNPTASASSLGGLDDWFVKLYPSTRVAADLMASHLLARTPVRRVAAFLDLSNAAYSRNWLEHFTGAFAAGGGRVLEVPFTSGQVPSYQALVADALGRGADGVLVIANALDAATLCQQVRKLSADLPIFGAEWGFTSAILSEGGRSVEGAIFPQMVDPEDPAPRMAAFRAAFRARFDRSPDFAAILSYEAVRVIARGLERTTSREGLRAAVLGLGEVEGLQQRFHIDAAGDADLSPVLMTIRNGRPVRVP